MAEYMALLQNTKRDGVLAAWSNESERQLPVGTAHRRRRRRQAAAGPGRGRAAQTIAAKAREWDDIVKTDRTHMQNGT